MAVVETAHAEHHEHEHPAYIAHHFDTAEQQFDSGKLGIWVFLVTEVLFFSGLFVLYTLWRYLHPEIFEQAHVFLNKYLGALNTLVLLFSSLTVAWAVRSAQLAKNGLCAVLILITMICAAVFLGVKAIEYSHKWDMGILVRSKFNMIAPQTPDSIMGQSAYLIYLSIVPAILGIGFLLMSIVSRVKGSALWSKFWMGMVLTIGGYFLGVMIGIIFMNAIGEGHSSGDHAEHASTQQPMVLLAEPQETATQEPAAQEHTEPHATESTDDHAPGTSSDHEAHDTHSEAAHEGKSHGSHDVDPEKMDRDIGIFFSIYYCMTGLHAVHIIAGIAFLAWIFYRSLAGHWRPDYFGPVDYVGLYWHLVDLIWIYLFPMLYLID
jgi:cytochrome c oxidase subunit 3